MFKIFEKHNKLSWFFVIVISIIIFYFSSLPAEKIPLPAGFEWQTTAYHFIIFFSLVFFLLPALVKGKEKNFIFVAIILAVMYGVLDEFHQLFVPGRACVFSDFLIDFSGILLASFIYAVSLRLKKF